MRRRPPSHFAYPHAGTTVIVDTDEYLVEALGGGVYRVTIDREDGRGVVVHCGTRLALRARIDRDARAGIRQEIKDATNA